MKKLSWLMITFVLVACSPLKNATPTIFSTSSFTPVPPTTTSTATPTSTPQGTVVERCSEILPALPESNDLRWTLVVETTEGLSLVNYLHGTQRTIPGLVDGVGTSPNGKWLSYISLTPESSDLILESADEQKQLTFENNWSNYGPIRWLNNEQVLFLNNDPFGGGPQTIVLNPFTGEQQTLFPDYPDFPFYGGGSVPLYFGTTNVIYDPLLKYAVYPQSTADGNYLALWDRETKQTVAKVLSDPYEPPPLWFPDGHRLLVAAFPDRDYPRREWFMVNREGEIRQLTHFRDLFPEYRLGYSASLSPDGRYLAFGLSRDEKINSSVPTELFLLDLTTLDVYNTCIPFDDQYPPVWAPSEQRLRGFSEFLAVQYLDPNKKYPSVVVVDIQSWWAANVFADDNDYRIASGWFYSRK